MPFRFAFRSSLRGRLWVANYSDHTALVFRRTATGNAAPKRIHGPQMSRSEGARIGPYELRSEKLAPDWQSQNVTFAPSWICRALVTVRVMRPAVGSGVSPSLAAAKTIRSGVAKLG